MKSSRSSEDAPARLSSSAAVARQIDALVRALPVFDAKVFEAAVTELKEHPRASLHYLFDQFGRCDESEQAMISRILVEVGGADVIDNLNAIIFDTERSEWIKVLAYDLLERLGQPMDPDVFAMSVPDLEPHQAKLPSRAAALLAEGRTEEGLTASRALHLAERAILIHDVLQANTTGALKFVEALVENDIENAMAVVAAVGAARFEPGIPLLQTLQERGERALQKLIRKTLFDLREDGVAVPDTKSRMAAEASTTDSKAEELPLHRALMSDPSPEGLVLVVLARIRQDRRLKVFSVLVSLWKRGIQQTATNLSMSRSSFDRFVRRQSDGRRLVLKEASPEDCRRMVCRGMCVAKEFNVPLTLDFGVGKSLLGNMDAEAAEMASPFLCTGCGIALEAETIEKIRASAPYDNMPVETRCLRCRGKKTP